mgnify:CR=1 FL=1
MSLQKNVFLRNVYRWHKIISIAICLPLILWALSGIAMPISHWIFKNSMEHGSAKISVNTSKFQSIQNVLETSKVTSFKTLKIAEIEGKIYYQVFEDKSARYFNTENGEELKNGDQIFAEKIAMKSAHNHSGVQNISLKTKFDKVYRPNNKVLPAYQIHYKDGSDVFVDTKSARMIANNSQGRKVYLWFFRTFHNMDFLDFLGKKFRSVVLIVVLFLLCLSSVSGFFLYGLMYNKFKKGKSIHSKKRYYHRNLGIVFSVISLGFYFTGLLRTIKKMEPKSKPETFVSQKINVSEVAKLPIVNAEISQFSVKKIGDDVLYRIVYPKDKIKKTQKIEYYSAKDGTLVNQKEEFFAQKLLVNSSVKSSKLVTSYEKNGGYGMMQKILPVTKIELNDAKKSTIYIDIDSEKTIMKTTEYERLESLLFSIFHTYSFMDFLGRDFKDGFLVIINLFLLTVSTLGMLILLKK